MLLYKAASALMGLLYMSPHLLCGLASIVPLQICSVSGPATVYCAMPFLDQAVVGTFLAKTGHWFLPKLPNSQTHSLCVSFISEHRNDEKREILTGAGLRNLHAGNDKSSLA